MNSPSEFEQNEKIKTEIVGSAEEGARIVAREIAGLITNKNSQGESAVLGLATGSTPVPLYRELIRLHRKDGLCFDNVITFNLDEYYPISSNHQESYRRFMQEQLFDHIDIPPEHIYFPDGSIHREVVFDYCRQFEDAIEQAGGIDLQILGIGRTGHIGFNEPGSTRISRTRLITLDRVTRQDAARDFLGESHVPRHAITMGVGTIMEANRILLMAWGESKAEIIAKAVESPVSESVPASFLQEHTNVSFLVDDAAASRLTRIRYPWLVGPVEWHNDLNKRAICWLSSKLDKPILKLVDEEYSENGMATLITDQGPAYPLNIRIFNKLQHTITGWPGGKPRADDSHRPERSEPHPKHVVVLSPEPGNDMLAMGGTLERLENQGHIVEVVYMTSGSLGVPDSAAGKFAKTLVEAAQGLGSDWEAQVAYAKSIIEKIENKDQFGSDSTEIRQLKGLIRRAEAREACNECGIDHDHIHFLDLPFYELGRYRQFNLGEKDITEVEDILERFRPHQIYITGNRANPISVQALCFATFEKAFELVRRKASCHQTGNVWLGSKSPWHQACNVWLYNSDEHRCLPYEIDMAVPLSPLQFAQKEHAVSQHQSQCFQTEMKTKRDRETALLYDQLGLAEYEAIESFQRWSPS